MLNHYHDDEFVGVTVLNAAQKRYPLTEACFC